jgi:hypothetical protein
MAGSCEHVDVPSVSKICWEFLEWLSNCCILKKSSPPWSQSVVCYSDLWALMFLSSDSGELDSVAVLSPGSHARNCCDRENIDPRFTRICTFSALLNRKWRLPQCRLSVCASR